MEHESLKQAQERLTYKAKLTADTHPGAAEQAQDFCEGYKKFLDAGKTEREVTARCKKLLLQAGYIPFTPGTNYPAGTKVYQINRRKCVIAATIGQLPLQQGVHMNIAHIDSPRLDLKPSPLYESADLALLKTHYYGGIRKYQWATIPLALHGVCILSDGSRVNITIGENEDDPVFCVTDLLPHLSSTQNERKLPDGIRGEELNVLFGSLPVDDPELKERVKLNMLMQLNEQYGMTERDFVRAEIEVVPAFKARDVGLDRGMVGAYGQDDRVDAYTVLTAEIDTVMPAFTTVCVLTDKEETGSDGVTGLNSQYVFHFLQQLCAGQEADYIQTVQASKCLSADVTAAYDPTWADAFEPMNATYAGKGVALFKYTGARGKSGTSDAGAELVGYVSRLLTENDVAWQIGELGKVDLGGGGTVAKYVANQGVDVIDIGVPVLSMHSPFEVVSKTDVLMAYRAFLAFNYAED